MLKIGAGAAIPAFRVMDVIAAANRRQAELPPGAPRILRMEIGQPAAGAPAGACAVARAALAGCDPLGYTETLGLPDLRARIAAHIRDWYGLDVPARRIAITTGGSGAFPLAFLAAFNPGDRVALAAPYYPPYVNILLALGIRPVILPTTIDSRFQPSIAMLERLDPLPDGLIVASPSNPAGTMLHPDEFAALARWCHAHGVRLISDEIYHGLTYETPGVSATGFSDSAIVVNSFSKYFSMTGWRIGWMVLPEELVRPVERLAQNVSICAPHISQIVAAACFDCHEELAGRVASYRAARDHLLAALPRAGFTRLSPAEGAFYIFADIADRGEASPDFCARMLRQAGIAATPGVDFDPERGNDFVRFSYCGPIGDVIEAGERLAGWR